MKRIVIPLVCLMMGSSFTMANSPDNPPDKTGGEHMVPISRLHVYFDNDIVTIISPQIIYNVEIFIYDEFGEDIYKGYVEELDYTYVISLTAEEGKRANSIELVYGGHHLYKALS